MPGCVFLCVGESHRCDHSRASQRLCGGRHHPRLGLQLLVILLLFLHLSYAIVHFQLPSVLSTEDHQLGLGNFPHIFCFLCCRERRNQFSCRCHSRSDRKLGSPSDALLHSGVWGILSSEHFRCYDEDPQCWCAEVRLRSSSFFFCVVLLLFCPNQPHGFICVKAVAHFYGCYYLAISCF